VTSEEKGSNPWRKKRKGYRLLKEGGEATEHESALARGRKRGIVKVFRFDMSK